MIFRRKAIRIHKIKLNWSSKDIHCVPFLLCFMSRPIQHSFIVQYILDCYLKQQISYFFINKCKENLLYHYFYICGEVRATYQTIQSQSQKSLYQGVRKLMCTFVYVNFCIFVGEKTVGFIYIFFFVLSFLFFLFFSFFFFSFYQILKFYVFLLLCYDFGFSFFFFFTSTLQNLARIFLKQWTILCSLQVFYLCFYP